MCVCVCVCTDDSDEASVLSEAELQTGVLFILPHIISHDQAETFLSNVVAAGKEKEEEEEEETRSPKLI